MEAKNIILKSKFDQNNLFCKLYEVEHPRAIVQVIHGMKEHQDRYILLAEKLNNIGIAVITSDMRGHGPNTDEAQYGYMGKKKPWEALVNDQVTITSYLKEKYPDVAIYLFAHSMGTIIARNLLQNHDQDYEKVLLSGVPAYQFAAHFGLFIARIIGLFKSNAYISKMLEHMTLSPFTKAVRNYQTENDWISYNDENIKSYNNDPYCGIPFTISAYKALYHMNIRMHKSSKYHVANPELPILMLAGEDDPCTLGTKGLKSSIKPLQKAGYQYIHLKLFPHMRHEIINELQKEDVYKEILNFFS